MRGAKVGVQSRSCDLVFNGCYGVEEDRRQ